MQDTLSDLLRRYNSIPCSDRRTVPEEELPEVAFGHYDLRLRPRPRGAALGSIIPTAVNLI